MIAIYNSAEILQEAIDHSSLEIETLDMDMDLREITTGPFHALRVLRQRPLSGHS